MNAEERIERIEQDFISLAAEHEALWQISLAMFSVIPLPQETLRPLLTASFDSMAQQLETSGQSQEFRKIAAQRHDELSKEILGDYD